MEISVSCESIMALNLIRTIWLSSSECCDKLTILLMTQMNFPDVECEDKQTLVNGNLLLINFSVNFSLVSRLDNLMNSDNGMAWLALFTATVYGDC